ncbi:MAG: hypothetical protein QM765_34905 [Myxococcales bacterium]
MHRLLSAFLLGLSLVGLSACGASGLEELGSVRQEIQGKAGTYTVTMDDWGTILTATSPAQVMLTGTSSRNLTWAFSFVPDDAFGVAAYSGKSFSVTLQDGHEINSILSGLPQLVRLDTTSSYGAATFTARIVAAPAFASRSGTTAMSLDPVASPVMVRDPVDPLRYRVFVTPNQPITGVDFVLANGTRVAGHALADGRWAMDLTFTQLQPLFGQAVTVDATHADGHYLKYAVLSAKVLDVQVTTGDPYVVWPDPVCEDAVRACLLPGVEDLASCGSYRQVRTCRVYEPCLGEPATAALTPVSDPALASAVVAWNAATGGYTWSRVDATAYQVAGCGVTLAQVVDLAAALEQGAPAYSDGQAIDRATLASGVFCSTSYSSAGPELLQAIDAFGADTQSLAWSYRVEVPCHGCHQFDDRQVVYYPRTGRAVVLSGLHGYD